MKKALKKEDLDKIEPPFSCRFNEEPVPVSDLTKIQGDLTGMRGRAVYGEIKGMRGKSVTFRESRIVAQTNRTTVRERSNSR